jgi:hypothetical protein
MNSSDRIGILYQNSDRIRIRQKKNTQHLTENAAEILLAGLFLK